jgi:hypothetical protein
MPDKKTYNINNLSEEEQLLVLSLDPYQIQYIDNPSKELQLACAKTNITIIGIINHPCIEVQELALEYMQLSSENIKKFFFDKVFTQFIEHDHSKLLETKNGLVPNAIDENIIIKVLETFPKGILYFKKSSEAMQMAVAKSNPDCIKYIQNPCDKVKGLSVFL